MQVSSCSQLIIKGRKQDASLYILLKRCSDGAGDLSLRYFMFYVHRVLESSKVSKELLLFFSNLTHPRNFCIKRRQGLCFRALAGKKVEYIQLICLTFGERFTVMRAHSCTGRTFDWWAKTTSRHCETLCLQRRRDRY